MEDIKILRCLEDFDGLENDYGMKLKVTNIGSNDFPDKRIELTDNNGKIFLYIAINEINILNGMGFIFNYKPIKINIDKILNKYKEKEFEFGDENHCIVINKDGKLAYDSEIEWKSIGTKYYSQEDCDKILDELNG